MMCPPPIPSHSIPPHTTLHIEGALGWHAHSATQDNCWLVWHSFPNSTIVGCRAPAAQALNKLRLENSRLSRQLAEATEEARLHASLKERVAAQDAEVAELACAGEHSV